MGKVCFGRFFGLDKDSSERGMVIGTCVFILLIAAPFIAMMWQDSKWTENREKESRKAFASARYNVGDVVTLKPDNVKVVVVNRLYHFDSKSLTYSVKSEAFGKVIEVTRELVVDE